MELLGIIIIWSMIGLGLAATSSVVLNDRSYNWIRTKRAAIEVELAKHGYQIYEVSWQDCAPCQVRYGIKKQNEVRLDALSSRKFVSRFKECHKNQDYQPLYDSCLGLSLKESRRRQEKSSL